MNAKDAFALAEHKARYTHKDWIVYKNKSEEFFAEAVSADSLKRCLLASGTQGRWWLIGSKRTDRHIGSWWMGLCMMRQRRAGHVF